jgi:Cupin domain
VRPEGSGEPHDGPAGGRSGPVPPTGPGEPEGGAPVGRDRFAERGLEPSAWEAGPHAWFPAHQHPRAKLLVCRSGSIRFTLQPSGEERDLGPGDWLELPAGQDHSAIAGPAGVRCEEAFHEPPASG